MMRYDREDWEEYETTEDILRRDEDLELLVRDLTMEEEEDDVDDEARKAASTGNTKKKKKII